MSTKNYNILLIDDDSQFHQELRYAFRRSFVFEGAIGVDQLEKKLKENTVFDLILLDLVLDDSEHKIGLELIGNLKAVYPDTPIIIVTNDKKIDTVVEAMRLGATSFLHKGDYSLEEWDKAFRSVIERSQLEQKTQALEKKIEKLRAEYEYVNPPDHPLLGDSPQMEHFRRILKTVADDPSLTILITGETGVGKSIAARFLHYNSHSRREQPFEEILISNIPASLLESTLFGAKKGTFTDAKADIIGRLQLADKGIVFLDEIGDLHLDIQAKLLQFLQTKTIRPIGSLKDIQLDVQIVAATNKNLREEVQKGNFREDLYQRLKVFPIEIPPLRERREDILPLLLHFMNLQSEAELDEQMEPSVKQLLIHSYGWIGNIRELENAVKSMRVQCKVRGLGRINLACLPKEIQNNNAFAAETEEPASLPASALSSQGNGQLSLLSFEEKTAWNQLSEIEKALIQKNGVKKDVAALLDMKPDNILYRIKTTLKKHPQLLGHFPVICEKYKIKLP